MYLAKKKCVCNYICCICLYNWISVLFPKNTNFCPIPAESGATPVESGATPVESGATPVESGAIPAESGATPAESGDSVRNQWGTEKYCYGPPAAKSSSMIQPQPSHRFFL